MNRKERAEAFIRYLKQIRDEEGFAVVDVDLRGGVPLYNPISMNEQVDLSGEIYDYIDAQTNVVPAGIPLRVRFHGNIPEKEQETIRRAMQRHYVLKSLDVSWDLRANFRKMLLLALFGAAVLVVYFYYTYTSNQLLFTEILSIVGTFSLWEAANAFLLERPQLRRDLRTIEQNLEQLVEFVPDEAAPLPHPADEPHAAP